MKILITTTNPDIIIQVIDMLGDNFIDINQVDYVSIAKINTKEKPIVNIIHTKLKEYLYPYKIDYLIYPDIEKKILFADMDKTLVDLETMDRVAEKFDFGDKVLQLTDQALNGKLDFQETCAKKLKFFKGLDISHVINVLQNEIVFIDGAEELAKVSKKLGLKRFVCSSGYDKFAEYVANYLDFDGYYANTLEIIDNKLTGEVIGQRQNAESKKQNLEAEAIKIGAKIDQLIAIGDGANDIPMLTTAGLGIAYKAKDIVKQTILNQINFTDLKSVIYTL